MEMNLQELCLHLEVHLFFLWIVDPAGSTGLSNFSAVNQEKPEAAGKGPHTC